MINILKYKKYFSVRTDLSKIGFKCENLFFAAKFETSEILVPVLLSHLPAVGRFRSSFSSAAGNASRQGYDKFLILVPSGWLLMP